MQLDIAPLDDDGVPQLGRRILLVYRPGSVDDFDREWGDASSLGDPIDFVIGDDGVGRSVSDISTGFNLAQVWSNGTYVSLQSPDRDAELVEVAMTLAAVDETTWLSAREGAPDQRLVAVAAAREDINAQPSLGEPLPHWVLPQPWQLSHVTDMTIWTPEQRADAEAYSAANRPASLNDFEEPEFEVFYYGFDDDPDVASSQFVPHVMISAFILADPVEEAFPINYETISALGLDGVINAAVNGFSIELGTRGVRVNVRTLGLDGVETRGFLSNLDFATANPLDGFVINDPRFQAVSFQGLDSLSLIHI